MEEPPITRALPAEFRERMTGEAEGEEGDCVIWPPGVSVWELMTKAEAEFAVMVEVPRVMTGRMRDVGVGAATLFTLAGSAGSVPEVSGSVMSGFVVSWPVEPGSEAIDAMIAGGVAATGSAADATDEMPLPTATGFAGAGFETALLAVAAGGVVCVLLAVGAAGKGEGEGEVVGTNMPGEAVVDDELAVVGAGVLPMFVTIERADGGSRRPAIPWTQLFHDGFSVNTCEGG